MKSNCRNEGKHTRQGRKNGATYGIRYFVILLIAKGNEKAISDELDVLAHQSSVHADERNGQSI